MFEQASRKNLQFQSSRGSVGVSDLWKLPLTALNDMAMRVNKNLKELQEESFLAPVTPAGDDVLRLDIMKHIIKTRQKENEQKLNREKTKEQRQRLLNILESKQEDQQKELSIEELQKQIAELEKDL